MSPEENKKLVLDHYESFVVKQDAEAVRRQLAPDFRDHEMAPGAPAGPEGALQFRAMLHSAFPDLRITIEDIVAEGDRVAVRARWTGTHRGPIPCFRVRSAIARSRSRGCCSGACATASLWSAGRTSTAWDLRNSLPRRREPERPAAVAPTGSGLAPMIASQRIMGASPRMATSALKKLLDPGMVPGSILR